MHDRTHSLSLAALLLSSRYALTPAAPDFETALDLLRNDVTRLCVAGGVAPGDLGPAECMLPNLLALRAVARRRSAGAPPAARPHASSPQSDDAAVPESASPRSIAQTSISPIFPSGSFA